MVATQAIVFRYRFHRLSNELTLVVLVGGNALDETPCVEFIVLYTRPIMRGLSSIRNLQWQQEWCAEGFGYR